MRLILFLVAAAWAGVPPALAHGDAPATRSSAGKAPVAAADAEQQPFGIAGDQKRVDRTIPIRMSDSMRFSPSSLSVKLGETIRFVLRNDGKLMHEMVIGTPADLAAHAELMRKHPGMEHDEPHMAHVPPGRVGVLVWRFNRAGSFEFACLVAGHFEAGMKGKIRVVASP